MAVWTQDLHVLRVPQVEKEMTSNLELTVTNQKFQRRKNLENKGYLL